MSSVSDSCEWHIPISIATSDKPGEAAVKTLLEKKSCSVLVNGVQPDQWLKVSVCSLSSLLSPLSSLLSSPLLSSLLLTRLLEGQEKTSGERYE